MLCGETLCGDKLLFSFPLTKCQCTLTIECENRLFALTLVCWNTGRKRKYSLELDADWLSALVVQLSIIYQQKKLHGHIDEPIRLEILKSHQKNPKYFPKILNIFRNSKFFTKFL